MVKTLLFDMGGIVFIQDTAEAFRRFTEIGVDAHQFIGDFGQKGIFLDLESDRISDEQFRAAVSRLVGRELTWQEVQNCWLGFLKSVPSDRLEHLLQLRKKYRICLASNTNPFIMAYTRSDRFSGDGHGIGHYFDRLYCSYEMGICKPDKAFFTKILESEGIRPEETLFIDDSKKNIAAAESTGIKGLWVPSNQDWLPALLSVLPE
ncbi:MAG: HAD family phosphatase [Muribaculaceae bacterium]|nr:HAD family phosphatase [Muribaculaceae bacterium]